MEPKMLHMLLVVDWVGDLALADWRAPEDENDFEEVESDVRDAHEQFVATGAKREPGPWLFVGTRDADSDDPAGFPVLEGAWRRPTAEEAARWCENGLLWAKPGYLVG